MDKFCNISFEIDAIISLLFRKSGNESDEIDCFNISMNVWTEILE